MVLPLQDVVASVPDFRNDFYPTQYGPIQSHRVVCVVMASLGLEKSEEFGPGPPLAWRPDRRAEGKAIDRFLKQLTVSPVRNSKSISLKTPKDLSNTYTRAQVIRIDREARYSALRDASPEDLPEILDSMVIQGLTARSAERQVVYR